jgi:EPS-associated MarR family transcriptional regulator
LPGFAVGIAAMTTDVHYKLMQLLEANPEMSQREAARELGISLGKVNYCLQALIDKGWIKAKSFKNSQNKAAYIYLLTPHGIEQKATLAVRFLQRKMQEYEQLRAEIKQMRREAKAGAARALSGADNAAQRKVRDEST